MKKTILLVFLAVIIMLALLVMKNIPFGNNNGSNNNDDVLNQTKKEIYSNSETGFSFIHKENYILLEGADAGAGNFNSNLVLSAVLMLKEDYVEISKNEIPREGSPTINFLVFKNPSNLAVSDWLKREVAISNLNLLIGEVENFSVDGLPAARYLADGLYISDNIAFLANGYIYFISGSSLDENSEIRRDFLKLIQTVRVARLTSATPSPSIGGEFPDAPSPAKICYRGGCSGQICSGDPSAVSTCEWREEYACYATAVCEVQNSGECGWTETPTLKACLLNS